MYTSKAKRGKPARDVEWEKKNSTKTVGGAHGRGHPILKDREGL